MLGLLCRLDEQCNIQLFERGPFVSFANCGLPYFVGNVIEVCFENTHAAAPQRQQPADIYYGLLCLLCGTVA
jgi:hypothetical protein